MASSSHHQLAPDHQLPFSHPTPAGPIIKMVTIDAVKKRQYRQKVRQDPEKYERFKTRDALRKRQLREQQSEEQKQMERTKARDRARKYRERMKGHKVMVIDHPQAGPLSLLGWPQDTSLVSTGLAARSPTSTQRQSDAPSLYQGDLPLGISQMPHSDRILSHSLQNQPTGQAQDNGGKQRPETLGFSNSNIVTPSGVTMSQSVFPTDCYQQVQGLSHREGTEKSSQPFDYLEARFSNPSRNVDNTNSQGSAKPLCGAMLELPKSLT